MATITDTIDFIDPKEEGFAGRSENYIEKSPKYVEAGILNQGENDEIIKDLQELEALRKAKNEARKVAADQRKAYAEKRKAVEKKLRLHKKKVDANPLATPEMKRELYLVNEKRTDTTNNKSPNLHGRVVGGVPRISYVKKPMQGIKLYGKINDGEYDFETTVNGSFFEDTRPRINPKAVEVREYYAYYMYENKRVGRKSEPLRTVLPPIE